MLALRLQGPGKRVQEDVSTAGAARLAEIRLTPQRDLGRPDLRAKIFRFRCQANQRHISARLAADEGRWPSSRMRGEMRWTLMAR
jgi:hypothetical protein